MLVYNNNRIHGSSLGIQLGLDAFTAVGWAWVKSLVGELRSRKLCGAAKNLKIKQIIITIITTIIICYEIFSKDYFRFWASLVASRVQSLSREDLLEKEMAPHSRILAWRIPWTEEPGKLQSMGSQRVGHD